MSVGTIGGVGVAYGVSQGLERGKSDRDAISKVLASQVSCNLGLQAKTHNELIILKSHQAVGKGSTRDIAIKSVISTLPIEKFFKFKLEEILFSERFNSKLSKIWQGGLDDKATLELSRGNTPIGILEETLRELNIVYSESHDIPQDYKVTIEKDPQKSYEAKEPVFSIRHEMMGESFWTCYFSLKTFKEMAEGQSPKARL